MWGLSMKTETRGVIKSSPWTAERQAANAPQKRLKTLLRMEIWFQCLWKPSRSCGPASQRMRVLISDVPDTEGFGSTDLPMVMACRWSFIYLEMPSFYQRRR